MTVTHTTTYSWRCPLQMAPDCRKQGTLEIDGSSFVAWRDGALIQDAFPDMSIDDRELLQTGICGPCWEFLGEEE